MLPIYCWIAPFKHNKIKMEVIRCLPKVLSDIEDIPQGVPTQDMLLEYRRNVREFIKTVTQEVSDIIDRYERRIADLKEENSRLREREHTKELPIQTAHKTTRAEGNHFSLSGKRTNLEMMQTAKSNIFAPFQGFQDEARLSAVLSKYKGKNDSHFPVELINPQPGQDEDDFRGGKSHFQIKSNRKKQREEELRTFLESGQKSMNFTTKRFLESIGRSGTHQADPTDTANNDNRDHSDSSHSTKKNESVLNQSLGNICNSLDNSFISKRARSGRKKRSGDIEADARRKQRQEEEIAKMMKGKSIKNLLMRLRENVETSPKKAPEMIKSSKLISCGPSQTAEKELPKRNSSKVMINPVPVDIVRKSKASKRDRSESPESPSPAKRSILKQSSRGDMSPTKSILKQTSQILSKSISGISAIEFAD